MRSLILLIALLVAMAAPFARAAPFSHDVGSSWSVRQADGLCLLEAPLRDFGAIRFVGAPGAPLRLEVLGHRNVFADGAVGLVRVAPPWHPSHPEREPLGETEQRSGSSVLIGDPLATRVLMALYQGYEAHLEHTAWYGGQASVRIGNQHLRPRYETFARCLRNATARGWSEFERTRIEYESAELEISDADRVRLRQVAEYVLADPAVVRVYVDGHTDGEGAARANLTLSRQRARAVADYLAAHGVPRERLVVRYHGSQYPVAQAAAAESQARNRRTTVRLEREWADADVAAR